MSDFMHAAVISTYGQIEWKRVPKPRPLENNVLMRVDWASICGTDQHIFAGEFGERVKLPLIPGHEFAGTVVEIGKNIKNVDIGDRVAVDPILWCGQCHACKIEHYPACASLKLVGIDQDGGFAEFASIPEFMLYSLPDDVSLQHAALVEIFAIGFHAVKRGEIKSGDSIAIWGAGKVGQSILQAARTKTKAPVFIVDVLSNRLGIAKQIFPEIITINATEKNPVEFILDATGGKGVDAAFEAVGHAKVIPDVVHPVRGCIQSIRGAGTVCALGLSDDIAPLLMKELIFKEARLVASRVSHGEFKDAIDLLSQGALIPDPLISEVLSCEEIGRGFRMLKEAPEKYLKILINFRKG